METLHKKPGLPRIQPTERQELEDENGHLWAVSYADLLMVLLCFFILFFSVDKEKKLSVIQTILLSSNLGSSSAKGKARTVASSGSSAGSASGYSASNPPLQPGEAQKPGEVFKYLRATLAGLDISSIEESDRLLLLFPENIYKLNQVNLPSEQEKRLRSLVKKLLPFKDLIQLTFVGSTDSAPIRNKSTWVQNNFELSSLRANNAMNIASKVGFPKKGLRSMAFVEFERNLRTFSI